MIQPLYTVADILLTRFKTRLGGIAGIEDMQDDADASDTLVDSAQKGSRSMQRAKVGLPSAAG